MLVAVLAGGESRRMGVDKAFLPIHGEPMIYHVLQRIETWTNRIVISSSKRLDYSSLGYPVLRDIYQGKGPLSALNSVFTAFQDEWIALAPCDSPFLNKAVYEYLTAQTSHYQAVIPYYKGRYHPLAGLYHRDCSAVVKELLHKDKLAMKSLYHSVPTKFVDCECISVSSDILDNHFLNINHPEDYDMALHMDIR
ncbi:molybdenum cofactor guanylyltransferase [Pontibacillus salicampi]|uniref:Probable molybdenum cofactor guanylyltransferase n=1 Tax=Pontibacillus salicampi TaxID=1449801 RepID=A0ABV6LLP2_9BACI